jgi:hypothetical protein
VTGTWVTVGVLLALAALCAIATIRDRRKHGDNDP